ncbi:Brevis radix [Sesbania bispinosa]|nr:Brevis radix [Sesbania bispinosa]
MFQCISCSKQAKAEDGEGRGTGSGTPKRKEAVKSLTSQVLNLSLSSQTIQEMFDRSQAQAWWGMNYERIMELYNVQSLNHNVISTSERFEDEGGNSPVSAWVNATARTHYYQSSASGITLDNIGGGENFEEGGPSNEAARISNSSIQEEEAELNIDNEPEWIEQDQPGVLLTIRALPDGTKILCRVSRRIFNEESAKLWWEANRERIEGDYL